MESDEFSVAIAGGKLVPRVKHEIDRSPMRRKCRGRKCKSAGTASLRFSITAIFRIEKKLLLPVVVETIRPAEIGSLFRAKQHLGRPCGIVFSRKLIRPKRVELITIVHRDVEAVVPCDGKHLAEAGRVARAVVLFLSKLVLIEFPDADVFLEELAWILSADFRAAIRNLAGIGWSTHIDVERALAVECDAFVTVLAFAFETGYDNLGRSSRLQLSRRHLETLDRIQLRDIEVTVVKSDSGNAAFAEGFLHFEFPITV